MNRTTALTLIAGGMLFIAMEPGLSTGAAAAPLYDVNTHIPPLPFAAPHSTAGTSVLALQPVESDTAIAEDWMISPPSDEKEVVAALAQSRIDVVLGLLAVDEAKAILSREGLEPFRVEARTVVDPEEDFRIAEVAFMIDAGFETAMRVDRKLTRELTRRVKIPFYMALTVRDASEELA